MFPRTAAMYFLFISWICHYYIESFSETDVICYLGTHYQFLLCIWTRSNTIRGRGVKRKNEKERKKEKSSLPLNQRYLQKPRKDEAIYSFHYYPCQTSQGTDAKFHHKVKINISVSYSFYTQFHIVNNGAKPWCGFREQDTEGKRPSFLAGESRCCWTLSMDTKNKKGNTKNYNMITIF